MSKFQINTKIQNKLFEPIEIVIDDQVFQVREHLSAEFMHDIDSFHTDPEKAKDPKGAMKQFMFWTGCPEAVAEKIDARILVQALDFFLSEIRNPTLNLGKEELKNSQPIPVK